MAMMHPGDTVGIYPLTSTFDSWTLPGGVGNTFAGYLVARYSDPNYVPPDPVVDTTPAPTTSAVVATAAAP